MPRLILIGCVMLLMGRTGAAEPWNSPGQANPFLPGYFADPSILEADGRFYLYATIDPWGGDRLACWVSEDFREWTYHELNWPTKTACTTDDATGAMVWAPSVTRGPDGRFYQYTSIGSEIWVGVADHPLGPWRNALGDRPLIPRSFARDHHMIDADVFIDDDDRIYLYWGSGWNWVNGACFAVELEPDMITFRGEPRVVTPPNYFEAPAMLKHNGRYYLTYSSGKTTSDTYQVHYAIGETPWGPFTEAPNSPVLVTDHERQVVSPGHHGFVRIQRELYMAYHRHRIPFVEGSAYRQISLDRVRFDEQGLLLDIEPTHAGPPVVHREADETSFHGKLRATASSQLAPVTPPEAVLDGNYATRWAAPAGPDEAWLRLDLGEARVVAGSELRFEYPARAYAFWLQASQDGRDWTTLVDQREHPLSGSPVRVEHPGRARYLRLTFPAADEGEVGLWEWRVR